MLIARHRGQRGIRRRIRNSAVDVDDDGNLASGECNIDFSFRPLGVEHAGPAHDDDLATLEHLALCLAPQIESGDVLGLIEEHTKSSLLQAFFEATRQIEAVAVAV